MIPVAYFVGAEPSGRVAELTGPYGPVLISEKVVQRLWARGVFLGVPMRLVSGKILRLVSPGRANTAEGPDFLEAAWEIDGRRAGGDVELHFYRRDWAAHAHAYNPAFSGVALHAVVFPAGADEPPVVTASGRTPEELVLLPYLPEDLETAAFEDAVAGAAADPLAGWLGALAPTERADRLRAAMRARWDAKVAFARRRVEADGVARAVHGMVLETLGLRRNRAPMAALAARYAPADFARLDPEEAYHEQRAVWRPAGVRPANHPLARLRAYRALCEADADWPAALAERLAAIAPGPDTDDSAAYRRAVKLTARRGELADRVFRGKIGGSRFDTVMVDAVWPWHAAVSGRDAFAPWRHWPVGDAPDRFKSLMAAESGAGLAGPASNGLFQALLALAPGV